MIFTGQEAHLVGADWFESKGRSDIGQALRSAPWAHTVGEDQYGAFADLRVGEAKQCLRWIMPGEFMMGSPEDEKGRFLDEEQHPVTIAKGFWMADTPCTQLLWSQVMGSNPSLFKNNPNNPVERVSWHDIQGFCARLGRFAPGLDADLPTEEEWEYACRAGTAGPRYGEIDDIAWHAGNSGEQTTNNQTHPVGLLEPNPWGLYDMLGNVWEWAGIMKNWLSVRNRGGAWDSRPQHARSARRVLMAGMDAKSFNLGFRFTIRTTGREHHGTIRLHRHRLNGLPEVLALKDRS